jgi:WbqC-like protein family
MNVPPNLRQTNQNNFIKKTCMRTIGIIQPNYIPWRGFFDFIYEVDIFVFLDNVQYTPRDWRSRNKIKLTTGETRWLTVPVTGGRDQIICDVKIDNSQKWAYKHLQTFRHNYRNAPFFKQYFPVLEEIYAPGRHQYLSSLNIALTLTIAAWLGLEREYFIASKLDVQGSREERLINIVKTLKGTAYLSGPAAKNYINPNNWSNADIMLRYKDYSGYPEYQQIAQPFTPDVTILDLLFMLGADAPEFIWGKYRQNLNRNP